MSMSSIAHHHKKLQTSTQCRKQQNCHGSFAPHCHRKWFTHIWKFFLFNFILELNMVCQCFLHQGNHNFFDKDSPRWKDNPRAQLLCKLMFANGFYNVQWHKSLITKNIKYLTKVFHLEEICGRKKPKMTCTLLVTNVHSSGPLKQLNAYSKYFRYMVLWFISRCFFIVIMPFALW
jgi:hypothetical protein